MEINNLPGVLWSSGPFPRVTKSDDCGICKESHFSWKPVLKRECSHYFHVRCHKRQVDFRANDEHLMRHERLPSCPVCKQVTKVVNVWTTGWKRENRTIERTEEGSNNRRRAEKKRIRNQKRHERRNRVTQFHQGSDSRGSQGGTTNVQKEQTGDELIKNLINIARDRPSDIF